MASRTELRGLLKQNPRASMITDERFPSSSSSKDQGKIKERKRRDTDNEISARSKAIGHRSNDCVNGSFNRDDELIKYMSKLPGYLQREVREGKVLNIGVLDWGSLEKWKHSQNGGRATECNNVLSNGPSTSGKTERKLSARTSGIIPKDSHRCKIDEQSASCSNLGKDYTSRDLQHSVQRVPSTLEAEPVSRDPSHKHQKPGFGYKSSGRDHAVADPGKGRKTQLSQDFGSSLFPDMGNSEGSLDVKEGEVFRDGEKQKRVEGKRHAVEAKQKSLNPVSDDVVIGGGQSVRSSQKITTESQEPEEAGLAPRKQENQFGNIVLLRPRKHTRSALPRKFLMSMDDDAQIAKPDEFSTCFANESSNSSELQRSQIPRSCPLSLEFGAELPSDALSEKEHSETVSRILDQEKSEEGFRRRRHPSPGKRSSFSFSLLSRSFSFKEDSAIQSDPMRFDDVSEKWNINRGARASPLRRLLDPLLKAKVSETALPSKPRSSSSSYSLKPTENCVPFEDEQTQDLSKITTTTTTTRAIVQLTIRNGFLLFQFVVDDDNSRCILGATLQSSESSSSKDDDSARHCTFYSVNEIKKKKSGGSWLFHGNRDKHQRRRGFVYNKVGQMRLINSLGSDFTELRESVLFELELNQSDKASETTNGNSEIAAMVIESCGENTIILQDGVHGFPNKGVPSPLIERWRTGGSCDCGGWDIGCKLRVLSNHRRPFHEFHESFRLWDQVGGSQQHESAAFRMRGMKKGMYKVEYGTSTMSHLQAFFTCVTLITTESEHQQRSDEPQPVARKPEEQMRRRKNREMAFRLSPFNPPLSPVGRV